MSVPSHFGRVSDNAGNDTPVVRSARIRALVAQRLAVQNITTAAPDAVEIPSPPEILRKRHLLLGATVLPGSDLMTHLHPMTNLLPI